MEGRFWDIRNAQQRTFLIQHLLDLPMGYEVQIKPKGKRTGKQNSAIACYCRRLAKALNDAGWDMKRLLKEEAEIPWTEQSARTHLWHEIQKALFGPESDSTTKLEKPEVGQVYEVLDRHIANKTGVSVALVEEAA